MRIQDGANLRLYDVCTVVTSLCLLTEVFRQAVLLSPAHHRRLLTALHACPLPRDQVLQADLYLPAYDAITGQEAFWIESFHIVSTILVLQEVAEELLSALFPSCAVITNTYELTDVYDTYLDTELSCMDEEEQEMCVSCETDDSFGLWQWFAELHSWVSNDDTTSLLFLQLPMTTDWEAFRFSLYQLFPSADAFDEFETPHFFYVVFGFSYDGFSEECTYLGHANMDSRLIRMAMQLRCN